MLQNKVKFLLLVILLSLSVSASFSSDIDTLALNMAKELKLTPLQPLSITVIPIDKNYMLGLTGIFKKLKEKLAPFAKEIKFNSVEGDDIVRTIIMSSDYAPIPVNERKADSLLMTGYYKLIDKDSSRVYFHIKVVDWNSQTLFESDPVTINSADCPLQVKQDIFDITGNPMKRGEIEYRGRIINDFDNLFYHTPNNLLANVAQYRFVNEHPYAFPWQLELLKDILLRRYGITLCDNCQASIRIVQSGSIIFSRDGKQYSRAGLVDGEALLPDSFPEEKNAYHYINTSVSNNERNVQVESKYFSTDKEKAIKDKIYRVFNEEYPKLFNPFNYDKLNEIFIDKNLPNILVGKVDKEDAVSGKEIVKYSWITKKQWLDNLKENAEKKQQTFRINTSMMGIFNDNLDKNRYWAIVKQKWESVDLLGHVTYTDNGFLFVNFDFTDSNQLKEFKIHYRLWFNDYKYDDVETGIKRYQKLENDIRSYFESEMGGIDSTLKKVMREFLIQKVKDRGSLRGK